MRQKFASRVPARPLGVALLSLLTAACGGAEDGPTGTASDRRVVTDSVLVLSVPNRPFEVVRERQDAPIELARLVPSPVKHPEGLDLPGLRLAPPATIRFLTPATEGNLRLVGLYGGHRDLGNDRAVRVEFSVTVDGEPRWSDERVYAFGMPVEERRWYPVGGSPAGLTLEPGSEVEVAIDAPDGAPGPWPVAYADLKVVRDREVPREAATPELPNVVMIVADTLRADRLGPYGYDRGSTPNLDRLAARGLVHERPRSSSSWTWPSTASLYTGRLPTEHGLENDPQGGWLVESLDTLPEAMSRAGYATAGWSGNPLVSPRSNFDQGFDRFEAPPLKFTVTREFLPEVLEWVREHRSERFFLYLQLVEAHWPYDALPEYLDQFVDPELRDAAPAPGVYPSQLIKALRQTGVVQDPAVVFGADGVEHLKQRYDACVATLDSHIGELLGELEALGLTDETLVVFTADHGEELFERGLLGHGYTVLDEQTHVPLILAGPGVPEGARQRAPVGNRHLAPALAARVGAPLRDSHAPPDLFSADPGDLGPVFVETHHGEVPTGRTPTFGIVRGPWLLSWMPDEFAAGRDGIDLYQLDRDPGATLDLTEAELRRTGALLKVLHQRLEEGRARRPAQGAGEGEGVIEMLQRAGYLEPR